MARKFDTNLRITNANPSVDNNIATGDNITIFRWQLLKTAEVQNCTNFRIFQTNKISCHGTWSDETYYYDRIFSGGRVASSFSAFLDKWSNVTFVSKFDATTRTAMFFDGTNVADKVTIQSEAEVRTSVQFGGTGSSSYLGATAHEVLWKINLTNTQIAALGRGVHPMFLSETKPYYYYPLEGNDGAEEVEYINRWLGVVVGTIPKATTEAPMEMLENYL